MVSRLALTLLWVVTLLLMVVLYFAMLAGWMDRHEFFVITAVIGVLAVSGLARRRKEKLIAVVCACALMSGCGSVSLVMRPGAKVTPKSRIAILSAPDDQAAVRGQLEHALLVAGFNITSDAVGRETMEWVEVRKREGNSESASGTKTEFTQLKADYILRFSYSAQWDITRWLMREFSATLIDVASGEVAASAQFSGGRTTQTVVDQFVAELLSHSK